VTPEDIEHRLKTIQLELNDTARWRAELDRKWAELQEERSRLLRLQTQEFDHPRTNKHWDM
jgi:hypothetical protein